MATIAEAAEHVFCDERTFKRYLDEGHVTRQPRGAYDLGTVRRECFEYSRSGHAGRLQMAGQDRGEAGARKDNAIAERYELEVAQKRGEMIPRPEVLAGMSSSFARVRAKMLALPSRLAPVILSLGTAAEIQEKLIDGIHEALAELAGTVIAGVSEGRPMPGRG